MLLASSFDTSLRRHFYLMVLTSNPYVGGVEQRKKPQATLEVSAELWLQRDTYLVSFLLDPEDVTEESVWNFRKGTGLLCHKMK